VRIGLLTGGGDCPGLNAVIRAVVHGAQQRFGDDVVGFRHGWRGVAEGERVELTLAATEGLIASGGTVLGTARFHPAEHEGGLGAVLGTVERERIDALVVVGGDGTLRAAQPVADAGVRIIGVPKTIDNDVPGTERCIGFDTAVATATEAIERVHTTAESHDRVMVVEVMGREAGWLAIFSAIASGANAVCIPEERCDVARLAASIEKRHLGGASYSIVVVAEGCMLDRSGGGAADAGRAAGAWSGEIVAGSAGGQISEELAARTGFETRVTVLGHIQRGGPPSAADRMLATRLGMAAADAAHESEPAVLMSLVADEVRARPLALVSEGPRQVPESLLEIARRLTAL